MSTTRLTTDQYTDGSITGTKLESNISIPSITSGSAKFTHGAGLTKNGSTLASVNGFLFKYSDIDVGHFDEDGNLYIKGDLKLGGTIDSVTTTVNTLEVGDSEIILNAGVTSPYAGGAKVTVDRGGANYDPYIAWDESTGYWKLYDGVNTARIIDLTYGDSRYASAAGQTFSGDIVVGSGTRAVDSYIRVISDDAHNAGFEAYGNAQGTGYLYVGQNANGTGAYGGGIFYSGDGTPTFASGESSDYICLYRMYNGTKSVVMKYSQGSNDVQFTGDITVSGNKITFGNGSTIDNETDAMLKIKGDGETYIYGSSASTASMQITPTFFGSKVDAESYSRTIIQYADGKIGFGPGTGTRDTWLYRDAANSIKTDGAFNIVGKVTADSIKIGTSTTSGYVLTADASGDGTWAEIPNIHVSGSDNQNVFTTVTVNKTGATATGAGEGIIGVNSQTTDLGIIAGSNITLNHDTTNRIVKISSSDTATAVDNILDGSNTGTAITYAPYATQQAGLTFDTSATNPSGTSRLNLNGYLYGTRLYSNGSQCLTLAGGTIAGNLVVNTNTGTNGFYVSRSGSTTAECAKHYVNDGSYYILAIQDEATGNIIWQVQNADTESGGGVSANNAYLRFSSDATNYNLAISRDGSSYYNFWHANNLGFGTGNTNMARGDHTHANLVAGNGITGTTYTGASTQTWSVASHAGTAGSVGTLVIGADTVGVSLGTSGITACAGNDSRLSDSRTPTAHGDSSHNCYVYARITFNAGQSQAVWTHNKNWADYIVQLTPDSPETHFYYANKTTNAVTICLDDTAYEVLHVDVVLINAASIVTATNIVVS